MSTVTYWAVSHSADTTETGLPMCIDYLKLTGEGYMREQMLREWCRVRYGSEVEYVQGVAPTAGWTLHASSRERYELAERIKWGGYPTETRRIELEVAKGGIRLIADRDSVEALPETCPHCGQQISA
jgi:hypothetical protein